MTKRTGAVLGVDVGGTFTDVVVADADGRLHVAKVPTTPAAPLDGIGRGIRQVLAASKVPPEGITRVVHGTTRATNAILERKGARTAFLATRGFGDMLELGREARVEADRYDLHYEKPVSPVEAALTFEVDERMSPEGVVERRLEDADVEAVVAAVASRAPEAVAVCLLHAHANPAHEERLTAALRTALPATYVVSSSEVWPEVREYERALTTVMCAVVGPQMSEYLDGFGALVREIGIPAAVQVMDSSGGVMTAARAARVPIYTVESGGAAGVVAAGFVGRQRGDREVVSFDMGGTTAKAGVVRGGRPDVTHSFHVGGVASLSGRKGGQGFPVKIPVVDIAEVGAGGGSMAWVDTGGALRVGPQSAGADPGPACYGTGGRQPTVTDANVVLGYLNPTSLAGGVALYADLAHEAIERDVAKPLGLGVAEAARGVFEIANLNMAAAIRVVTIQRGIDPRQFTLIGFGGAGPMHIAKLAEAFEISRAVVPAGAGVASAVGLIASDPSVDAVRTKLMDDSTADPAEIDAIFDDLAEAARRELGDAGDGPIETSRSIDVQYRGQAHSLNVAVPNGALGADGVAAIASAFQNRYRESYGIDLAQPTQFVNFRVRVRRVLGELHVSLADAGLGGSTLADAQTSTRAAHFSETGGAIDTPVFDRLRLPPYSRISGPAIVEELDSTLVVPPGWEAGLDLLGNVMLERTARISAEK